jgi:all-trans-retinol 13,14-reductase
VLGQHYIAGGLTQSLNRGGFSWDVGMHYLGQMGPGGSARVLHWLCDESIDGRVRGASECLSPETIDTARSIDYVLRAPCP